MRRVWGHFRRASDGELPSFEEAVAADARLRVTSEPGSGPVPCRSHRSSFEGSGGGEDAGDDTGEDAGGDAGGHGAAAG